MRKLEELLTFRLRNIFPGDFVTTSGSEVTRRKHIH